MIWLIVLFITGFLLGGFVSFMLAGAAVTNRDYEIIELKRKISENVTSPDIKVIERREFITLVEDTSGYRHWVRNESLS